MSKLISPGHYRIAIQICAASAVAALLSGCSSDASRFNDPFSNPFATGSIAKPQRVASNRATGIGRTPPVVSQALPPRPASVASAAPATSSVSTVSHETTGSISQGASVPGASFGGWSATGGTSIVVAQGESADVLSKRYGVPQNALLGVNGLHGASDIQPGARLTIPIYNAVATAGNSQAPVRRAQAPAPKMVEAAPVKPEPARRVTRVVADAAPAPAARPKSKLKVAKAAPEKTAAATPRKVADTALAKAVPAKPVASDKVAVAQPALKTNVAPVRVARLAPPARASTAQKVAEAAVPAVVAPRAVDPAPTASVPPAKVAEAVGPEFRWPARGRIIQGFKGGNGGNDGINIAVPEGTAVKAAENGVVAYAGSELKGYGNMVLIRHPNGFVSAYANNGEIAVKKGDTVKRGQVIAKSGQTGNVASPQLHFELRKGSQPVDPTSYLAGL